MRILHLSDLHYGVSTAQPKGETVQKSRSMHYFTDAHGRPDPDALAGILSRDVDARKSDVVIVSGDIGWSGTDDDYRYSLRFFQRLGEIYSTDRLLIIPGNHDVDRAVSVEDDRRQDGFIRLMRDIYGESFAIRFPFLEGSTGDSTRSDVVTFYHQDPDLLIVGVNSAAWLSQVGTPVYVGPDSLQKIEGHIASLNVDMRALRVFVIHHHLLPFAEPSWEDSRDIGQIPDGSDPTIVANSAKLQGWLSHNSFHIVLHGHKHIPHGREDTLWRTNDPGRGSRLLIVGAGSAGVAQSQRAHEEPIVFNIIDVSRLATNRWDINVRTRRVTDAQVIPAAVELYGFRSHVGPPAAGVPTVVTGQKMDDCHYLISELALSGKPLHGFLSTVEQHDYHHPPTARIGTRTPTEQDVYSSFRSLHPEWHPESGWDDPQHVDRVLRSLPHRYQFQHGPRLFGVLGRAGTQLRGTANREVLRPIYHALEALHGTGTTARSFVGLYNPEVDLAREPEPLPGLMSVQFVADGQYLDAVATFRKLELSFWWVVNMLELGELLRWAASRDTERRVPRRITFFASLAEWKEDPEPTFVTALDQIDYTELFVLVSHANDGELQARNRLIELLDDQSERTNERNIDDQGLQRLAGSIQGAVNYDASRSSVVSSPLTLTLAKTLLEAAQETKFALDDPEQRVHHLKRARNAISRAVDQLTDWVPSQS